jgi:adhesin transport system outer membrane protein
MPVARVGMTLTQNVFSGFETQGEVSRNRARANSAAYQLLASIQDTTYNIAQYYLEVLQEQELVRLAEVNVSEHRKISDMVGKRAKAGLSNDSDYKQTQGRLALAESQLLAEKSNLQDVIARYKTATGEYPENLSLPHSIPHAELPKTEHEAIHYAVSHYPVVKSAQADVAQACEQHEVSKAPNYPRLDILADINRNRNEGGLRGPSYDQAVFLQATYDIYAGGSKVARQKETSHLFIQAQEIMQNSVRQAKENTKIAWDLYDTARKVSPMLKEHRDSTVNTVNAYHSQFTLGKRTLFDLLDVQNELYNANKEYTSNRYKILISQYRLLHSMGVLAQRIHVPLPAEIRPYTHL